MKHLKKKLIFVYIVFLSIIASGQTTFEKVYFVPGGELLSLGYFPNYIDQKASGDFITAGARGTTIETSNTFLLRINSIGDTIWSRTINQAGARSIIGTSDNGFLISTSSNDFIAPYHDLLLIKTDSIGDTLWTKTIGSNNIFDYTSCIGYSSIEINNFYITIGKTNAFGSGNNDIYLIKNDLSGNTLWSKTIGSSGDEYGTLIKQTSDQGFIICGQTTSVGAGSFDVILVKTDSLGNPLWAKTYGATGAETPSDIIITDNNEFIVLGYTTSFDPDDDIFLLKTDSTGSLLWTKTIGNDLQDIGYDIISVSTNGYLIAGATQDPINSEISPLLISLDLNCDTIWSRSYGNSLTSYAKAVNKTNDGGYIMSAQILDNLGSGNSYYPYLIKTDSNGNNNCSSNNNHLIINSVTFDIDTLVLLTSSGGVIGYESYCPVSSSYLSDSIVCPIVLNEHLPQTDYGINVFPNPSMKYINVSFDYRSNENYNLMIYDSSGRIVKQINNINSNHILIKTEDLTNGIYYLQLYNETGIEGSKKIIVF